ncbi:unnamed protein product [Eruca vesicaria subsp. sativa]|uniref:Uncharacterized protein n=1 Tax=Eruca vesicaria subsp. sativa TaxID=29727 RepID=A0ABC8LBZ9_ERUVS|nr:unnamed protein product [Eruca vesicaria subsp. sativa]
MEFAKSNIDGYQNVIVMRHGDRMDRFEPLWASTAERPWDPPLIHNGMVRAFQTGQRISSQAVFPIHRVFVSPFLRCIQTAVEVITALSAVPSIDNSKLKVAIEFGLCEILNSLAIKSDVAPKDGKFDFNISDLEAMFPEGTVDNNADMVYKELPQWGESAEGFKERYVNTLKVLAEKYPSENLLLITHRGGVSTILYKYLKDATKRFVDYCGCVDLRRQDVFGESVDFKVVTSHGVSIKDHNVPIHDRIRRQSPNFRATMTSSANANTNNGYQNILMLRHGDRIDKVNPLWLDTASRPWDPPLVQDGLVRAFQTGQRIRSEIQFPIHRVFVSPFIRCVQTASEVISALAAVDVNPNATSSKDVISIDKSKLKVSIEFGLSEMLNSMAIKPEVAPKDGKFDFMVSDLEAIFPEGMVDHNVEPVYKEMPQWGETVEGCTERFLSLVKTLADKYPSENLLLVTHGEGVRTTFATFKDVDVYEVEYCACAELRRQVLSQEGPTKAGDFEVITSLGQAGIKYHSLTTTEKPCVKWF